MAVEISRGPVSLSHPPANELRSDETVLDKAGREGSSTTRGCCLCLFVSCLLGAGSFCVAQTGLECIIP